MILYLDTSALVKLYATEIGSDAVRAATAAAQACATHELSYVEARSAFARKRRNGDWSAPTHRNVLNKFDQDWPALHRVAVNPTLIRSAADLTDRFALRAYDAVQLAAAHALQEQLGATATVTFCCFDGNLIAAAQQLKLGAAPSE